MKLFKFATLTLVVLATTIALITACGAGHMSKSSSNANHFSFDWRPAHLLGRVTGTNVASSSGAFVVNAQSTTPGGGNLSGFCNRIPSSVARGATVIFGLGRWSSGSCDDAATPDSSVGVSIPQNGQIGQLTVDSVGQGTAADSGVMEIKIIHNDSTEAIVPITCTLGVSSPAQKVHCEDKNSAHNTNVVAGDQVSARILFNPGDSFIAIRVNIQYAVPAF